MPNEFSISYLRNFEKRSEFKVYETYAKANEVFESMMKQVGSYQWINFCVWMRDKDRPEVINYVPLATYELNDKNEKVIKDERISRIGKLCKEEG